MIATDFMCDGEVYCLARSGWAPEASGVGWARVPALELRALVQRWRAGECRDILRWLHDQLETPTTIEASLAWVDRTLLDPLAPLTLWRRVVRYPAIDHAPPIVDLADLLPAATPLSDELEGPTRPSNAGTFIEIVLVDEQGAPIVGAPYELRLADGRTIAGSLGPYGTAYVEGIKPGECTVRFPRLHAEEVRASGGS